MKLEEGKKLFIRSLVITSSEVIPFFWPMRNFIHHNPLYGLEDMPFREAVDKAKHIFHARVFLPRDTYASFLKNGLVKEEYLKEEIKKFVGERSIGKFNLEEVLFKLTTEGGDVKIKNNLYLNCTCPQLDPLSRKIKGVVRPEDPREFASRLSESVGRSITLYEACDGLFGTSIGEKLNELVIKTCAEFLDEGQAVWSMPDRERGFYEAWRQVAVRNKRLRLKGCCGVEDVLEECRSPEEAILLVMNAFGVGEELWEDYIPAEVSKLHGWSGYIRWRSNARDYYWQRRYPADLVDYVAIRLLLSLALLKEASSKVGIELSLPSIRDFIKSRPEEALIRWEFFKGSSPPDLFEEVEMAIEGGNFDPLKEKYMKSREDTYLKNVASYLLEVCEVAGIEKEDLVSMSGEELREFFSFLKEFEREEGYIWLKAHENTRINELISSIKVNTPQKGERPLAQALFCIDVRSERFRRNLETIGNYETYGIAGFFGVPVSFIELGKGHETYLCPVLIKPKNIVMELHKDLEPKSESLTKVIKEILHDLKHNVLTPYITVEAIGLLFGFDMVGKTLFPLPYSKLRHKLTDNHIPTKLLIEKLSKEEVLEIVSLLQREIVLRAVERHLKIGIVRSDIAERLRKVALGEEDLSPDLARRLGVDTNRLEEFVRVLREEYKIERGYTRIQIEKLAKIGFTLEEQAFFVERALKSIGLTDNFGKFVLVVGHGSRSENNPYESALDCGACGGDHGAVNAKVFSMMANNPRVREKLRERGIDIPDDTYFLAGEHNTTTDEVEFFDTENLPATHTPFLKQITEDIRQAGFRTALERCADLECETNREKDAHTSVKKNSVDWTQVRPEWGLSGNYAFIIGGRHLTESINLEGKVFLHSYNWRIDPKGLLLEIILSGPLVVGEWINMEHYFSAVDNEHFGSGSKVYHNVVGRFGVMTGNFSDLRTGLPAQTVLKGKAPYHKPIRLITLVEAPIEVVKLALKGVRKVRELIHNEWINFIVLDPQEGVFYRYQEGEWKHIESPEEVKR